MKPMHMVVTLLALLFVAGCASKPAPITYYLLRGDDVGSSSRADDGAQAGLGRVIVATYLLSSKGIMVETGDHEITPATLAQWAEPLDAGMRWYLHSELGIALGGGVGRTTWDYTVDVLVAQLHATMSGTALIDAEFLLIPADRSQAISEHRFAMSIPLPEAGYAGVVAAERELVKGLADRIAEALADRRKP